MIQVYRSLLKKDKIGAIRYEIDNRGARPVWSRPYMFCFDEAQEVMTAETMHITANPQQCKEYRFDWTTSPIPIVYKANTFRQLANSYDFTNQRESVRIGTILCAINRVKIILEDFEIDLRKGWVACIPVDYKYSIPPANYERRLLLAYNMIKQSSLYKTNLLLEYKQLRSSYHKAVLPNRSSSNTSTN